MFAVLLFAATLLNRISEYIVQGVPPATVLEFVGLILPGVLAKAFPMATLLATLLAFGRLSADSEVTAMRASGAGIYRIMAPVAILCTGVAVLAFVVSEFVVPPATARVMTLQSEVARTVDIKGGQPQAGPIVGKNGEVSGYFVVRDFNIATKTASNVVVISFDEKGMPKSFLMAKQVVYTGNSILNAKDEIADSGTGWRIQGGARFLAADGSGMADTQGDVWPSTIPKPMMTPQQLIASKSTDGDAFTISQLTQQLQVAAMDPTITHARVANMQFWLWNKFALPLTAVVFGLLGAPLGIRNVRGGTAVGFALSVGIIFLYIVLVNFLNVFAQSGRIPASVASFTPIVLGLLAAVAIMWRRDG